ncbi:hypothetical protein MMC24_005735 [Lignoscripta atroalba]|nr:hypothetical protein [Lignoscripta atroalba]
MAYDLQARFRKLRAATSGHTSLAAPTNPVCNRDNRSDKFTTQPEDGLWGSALQQDFSVPYQGSTAAADRALRAPASVDNDNDAATPPIDVPSHHVDGLDDRTDANESAQESRYHELSPLEEFLRTRRPSISFSPQVILDSGHRRALDEPLPKLEIKPRQRGRSLLQELSERPVRSPLARTHSETDRAKYNPVTGELLKPSPKIEQARDRRRPAQLRSHYPLLQSTINGLESDPYARNSQQSASLTSDSTASPIFEEVRTPSEAPMDCLLSPMSPYSPFYHPTSLEESSAWPKPRHQGSSSRAKSYTFERNGSIRQGRRQGSRRSTSSSMSPATAFLAKWGKEDTAPPEPDDEGQEVGDYVLGKQVGFGGFSVVREAYTLEGDKRVCRAVKIVRKQVHGKEDIENEQLQAEFEHEVGLWRCLSHQHILPLVAVYVTDFATFCFTQLNSGGTLFDLVRANRQGIRKDLARRYAYQLASAIRYLHEDVRVVHRDIKLENCLIDLSHPNAAAEGGKLLLCDFGLAEFVTSDTRSNTPDAYERATDRPLPRNIGPSDTSTSVAGSLQYASPELILSPNGILDPTVDIWAFGVVVYSLLVGDLPFQHTFQPRVQMMILAGEWDREALRKGKGSEGCEDEVEELVSGCLEMDVEERWNIGNILESRWLNGCQEMLEEVRGGWRL